MSDQVSAFRKLLEVTPAGTGNSIDLLLAQMPPTKALLLRLAAIPHRFDKATLAILAPQQAATLEFDRRSAELTELSVVLRDGNQFMLHDDARAHLLRWWQQAGQREQLRQASSALVEWLMAQLDRAPEAAAELNYEISVEEIRDRCMYHQVAVDAGAGFADFEQIFAAARHRFDLTRCATLLQLMREQAPLLDSRQRVKLDYHAGKLAADNQHYELAGQYFDQVLASADLAPVLRIKTLARQGHLAAARGQLVQAQAHYRDALQRAERDVPDYPIDELLHDLAVVERDSNNLAAAERGLEQAISIAQSRHGAASLAACYNALGTVHLRRGDHLAAISAYELSLENLRQAGEHFRTAQALNNLGMAWVRQGDLEQGEQLLRDSLQIKREAGDSVGQANTLGNLVEVYRRRGDTAQAIELNLQAIALFRSCNSEKNYAVAYRNLGSLYRDAGQTALAEQAFAKARERFLHRGAAEEADLTRQRSDALQQRAGLPWWAWSSLVTGVLVLILAAIGWLMPNLGASQWAFLASPDGSRWVVSVNTSAAVSLTVDGEELGSYDEILEGSPLFSPDSTRLAYAVRLGSKWSLILDGAGQSIDAQPVANSLAFSPDSKRFAYAAGLPGHQRIIVDNAAGPEFDEIFGGTTLFSPDSRQLSYRVRRGEKRALVLDHQRGPEVDRISLTPWIFSPDSEHTAYSVIREGRAHLVVDGLLGTAQDEIFDFLPLFSPDSKRLVYAIRAGDKVHMVIDRQLQPAYDEVYWGEQVFGPNSRRTAYGARRGEETFAVIDTMEIPAGEGLLAGTPRFSRDAKRLVYAILRGSSWIVVENGEESPPWEGILETTPQFSPDSRHLAYGAFNNGRWRMIVDGMPGAAYDELMVGAAVFSPDSQHVAYTACNGNDCFVVIDGTAHGPYEAVSPVIYQESGGVRYHVWGDTQNIVLVELDLKMPPAAVNATIDVQHTPQQ